jgi:hypothetical protein
MFSSLQADTLAPPRPPTPIHATLSFSLGGTTPGPPRTCLGTNEKPITAAEEPRNLRLVIFDLLSIKNLLTKTGDSAPLSYQLIID